MPLLRRFVAVLLLAVWLPAMLHCDLEAAGLEAGPSDCCNHAESNAMSHCAGGACHLAEGEFSREFASVLAPAPVESWWRIEDPVLPAAPDLAPGPTLDESTAAPPELRRRWVFATRAAPAPRAPSVAS